ncbi:hypothetical protein ACPCUV_03890 [Streptomyces platensis]|uniref:hypothetical protein n=1 Tax=Streptomyces platensis TaxID=58346 RepID=UPI003C300842
MSGFDEAEVCMSMYEMLSAAGAVYAGILLAGPSKDKPKVVATGIGLAVVPTLGLGPLPAGVRVVDVEPPLIRRVYATWRTDGSVRPSVLVVVEALAAAGGSVGRASSSPGIRDARSMRDPIHPSNPERLDRPRIPENARRHGLIAPRKPP